MVRTIRWSAVLAVGVVLTLVGTAIAAVSYGTREAIPGNYAYNYSNSMDYTGTPGGASFRLQEAYVTDAAEPAVVKATRSSDGVSWSKPKKVSGRQNAEGSSLAAVGTTVIAGWMTGYSYYDAAGVPRQVQVNVSTDAGVTWTGVDKLSSAKGSVDYPIVAAGQFGATTNVYAAWVDSANGKVKVRQSSDGGTNWSAPITLGSTTAKIEGDAFGFSGYANIAAVGDRVTVAWIADDTGTMKVRSIDANGDPAAPATASNWTAATTLNDKISLDQNGWPIVSSSPLVPGVITIAYNTDTAQRYTTYTGGASAAAAGKTIYTNGTIGANTYGGGYSTVVEPAPGGFVAMWAGCRDVLTRACNYGSSKARFDLLESTSTDGTNWSDPQVLESAGPGQQLNDEPSIVAVAADGGGVDVFAQYNAYKSTYTYYDVWMKIGSGTL